MLDPNEDVSWKTQSLPVWILILRTVSYWYLSIINKRPDDVYEKTLTMSHICPRGFLFHTPIKMFIHWQVEKFWPGKTYAICVYLSTMAFTKFDLIPIFLVQKSDLLNLFNLERENAMFSEGMTSHKIVLLCLEFD